MLTCKISKLFIRTIVQLWILQVIIAFFSKTVRPRNCPNLLGQLCNFEFLQVIIAFFLKTVRPRNMKFDLQRVSIWVNIQKKFQVPRSHSIGEKCDANFKVLSHFSRKVCDRKTWNLVCKEYPYGLIYKKNFKFLGRTVSEKNAMLTCKISKLFIRTIVQLWIFASYYRIFLENCVSEEHEVWFAKSIHMG